MKRRKKSWVFFIEKWNIFKSLILKHSENFEIVHFLWSKSLFHHIRQTQPRTWKKIELLKRLLKCSLFFIYWMKHPFAWEKRFENLRDKRTEALNEIKDFQRFQDCVVSRLSSEKIQGKCGMKLRFVTNSLDNDQIDINMVSDGIWILVRARIRN